MFLDVSRAMRLVRERASEWSLERGRIGIMGSSAGGHLASTLLTHFDAGDATAIDPIERQSSRPDFGVLCYAVLAMNSQTHAGLQRNLMGESPTPDVVEFLSTEKHVRSDTPPCFIWHTGEDAVVPQKNALDFASALAERGVPFDLHIYERGRHGIGLGQGSITPAQLHPWTFDLRYWLNEHGLLSR
jgi:acetyl esterase/lipase